MNDWRFGDIIRRHDDGPEKDKQRYAMVIGPRGGSIDGHLVIGLRDMAGTKLSSSRSYLPSSRIGFTVAEYWTLVTDDEA